MKKLLITFLFLGQLFVTQGQTILPVRYWTFNTTPTADSTNNQALNYTSYGSQNSYINHCNGKANVFGTSSTIVTGGQVSLTNYLAFEFQLKPDLWHKQVAKVISYDPYINIAFDYPRIIFSTNHKSGNTYIGDDLIITLDGIGRKSYDYYKDGNYHLFVFKLNTITGEKQIWVDGQCPAGFSKTVSTGSFTGLTAGGLGVYFNTSIDYARYYGTIDEVAVYNVNLPPSMIYKHYLNFLNCQSYSYVNDYTGNIPSATSVNGVIDSLDFPTTPVQLPSVQLVNYPTPRYRPNHTLLRNFNWMDEDYMGGQFQSWSPSNTTVGQYGTDIQAELSKNFNYYFNLRIDQSTDPRYTIAVNYLNANPSIPISARLLRAQINGNKPDLISQTKPNSYYLQNASGQFLDINGNVTSTKIWRPTAPANGYTSDGTYMYNRISTLTQLNRNISIVNENGEIFPHITNNALSLDPQVTADKNTTGLSWENYLGLRFKDNEIQSYRDVLMANPKLSGAKFTEYAIGGQPTFEPGYQYKRMVNSQINGQYYSTGDLYTRWPDNWRNWTTAWHGWQWFVESRNVELSFNDNYFSPFVSAGWDATEENNVRPGQWLGLLKSIGNLGAEFYYSAFFSISTPWPDSKNWIWQAAIPAYAQGIVSRYDSFYKNSYIMTGDVPASWSNTSNPGYSFNANDPRKLITVRKSNTLNKYIIVGTIQPNSNNKDNTVVESTATINLDGQNITFGIRRQGSTYIYDKTVTPPLFYQVDGWHESTHPSRWSKDFVFEAELADSSVLIKTEPVVDNNFTNVVSYIAWDNTTASYSFDARTSGTKYLYVRAKNTTFNSTTVGRIGVQLDTDTMRYIGCISDTNWLWYKYQTCFNPISYSVSTGKHVLKIAIQNDKTLIDKVVLSDNSNLYVTQPACSTNCSTVCSIPSSLVNVSIASTTATISWGSTGAPYGYRIKIKNFTTNITSYYTVPVGVTTLTLSVNPGTRYRWWVCSKCTSNSYSAYSILKNFTTPVNMAKVKTSLYTVQIYPNPADNYVNVKITSPYTEQVKISLFDYSGKFIQSKEILHEQNSITTVRLENVPPGIYLIFVNSDSIQYVEQLIIIRE